MTIAESVNLVSSKRHLMTAYGMTPREYRAKWGLPHDYPMVAPRYAASGGSLPRHRPWPEAGSGAKGEAAGGRKKAA